jgi:hypothetical protein
VVVEVVVDGAEVVVVEVFVVVVTLVLVVVDVDVVVEVVLLQDTKTIDITMRQVNIIQIVPLFIFPPLIFKRLLVKQMYYFLKIRFPNPTTNASRSTSGTSPTHSVSQLII